MSDSSKWWQVDFEGCFHPHESHHFPLRFSVSKEVLAESEEKALLKALNGYVVKVPYLLESHRLYRIQVNDILKDEGDDITYIFWNTRNSPFVSFDAGLTVSDFVKPVSEDRYMALAEQPRLPLGVGS